LEKVNMAEEEGPMKIEGATFICEVPAELGAVTELEVKNGKVVAETESGVQMIVPTAKR
jgi:hypothetical protein